MMRILAIASIFLLSCSAHKIYQRPTTIISDSQPGIKSITEKCYLADLSNGIDTGLRKRRYDFERDFVKDYDSYGRLIRETKFTSSDSLDEQLEYCYSRGNDSMRVLRKKSIVDTFKVYQVKYIDSNGITNIVASDRSFYYEETVIKNRKQRANNFLLNTTGYNSHYQWDNASKGKYEHIHSFRYKFDKKGNLIKSVTLNPNKTLWASDFRKYDSRGNLIQHDLFFPKRNNNYRDKDEKITYTYTYDLDTKGNWVKRVEYKNSNPVYVVIRQIEYY